MKISGAECGILALTAVFLLGTTIYYINGKAAGEGYTVSTQLTTNAVVTTRQTSTQTNGNLVNINTADVEELETLPGIGQVRAEAIVADREANGPFQIVEELTRVNGIGQGTMESLLEYITVN